MAINKKLIHFKKFSDFNSKKLSANEANTQYTVGISGNVQNGNPDILYESIVWIKDTKQQWTHGQLYDGTNLNEAGFLAGEETSDQLDDVETLTYVKYVPQTLTDEQKAQTRINIGAVSEDNFKTINGTSILGSGDITISGGSSSGGSGAYSEVNHGTNDTTFTLTPNIFHVWDEVSSLTLTLGAETTGVANEYIFQFTSGSEPTTLSLPDDIKWTGGETPTIEPNKIYQISILKGLGSMLEFSNAATKIDNYLTYASSEISFQYPVASEVTVVFYGRPEGAAISSAPTNVTLVYAVGEQTKGYKNIFNIVSITPSEDDTYNYLF